MRYGGFLLAELFDSLPNSIPLGSTMVTHNPYYGNREGAVKKINTQVRATILWKLGLADAAKKKHEPKKVYNKQAGG